MNANHHDPEPVRSPGLAFFSYSSPHKKSQDLLIRLSLADLRPVIVIGAPRRVQAESYIRTRPRHVDLIPPRDLCASLAIPYFEVESHGVHALPLLRDSRAELGVIGSARVLPREVLQCIPGGVINLHPGMLPAMRGLDVLEWAIYENAPLGVTAHLIDEQIDAGRLLATRVIQEYPDDSILDLSIRLNETQTAMVAEAVTIAVSTPREKLPVLASDRPVHRRMPEDLARVIPSLLARRLSGLRARLVSTGSRPGA